MSRTALARLLMTLAVAAGCGAKQEAGPCPASQSRCGAACVDEASDTRNCGGCGITCDQCTGGRCLRVLATAQPNPGPITVTATDVVWANAGTPAADGTTHDAGILKVPIGGGAPQTLATVERSPTSIATDMTDVYWTMGSSEPASPPVVLADGAVMKVSAAGGLVTALVSGQIAPWRLAVRADAVYWIADGRVLSVAKTGGTPTTLSTSDATKTSADALTVTAKTAYWVEAEDSGMVAFHARDLAPGSADTVLYEQALTGAIQDLVASDSALYWTLEGPERGAVQALSLAGGAPSTFFTSDDDLIDLGIVRDGDTIYWTNSYLATGSRAGRVLKAPLAGGAPETVSTAGIETHFMAVGATSVYFTDVDRGAVVQVTPK